LADFDELELEDLSVELDDLSAELEDEDSLLEEAVAALLLSLELDESDLLFVPDRLSFL
tara:strand:- start:20390 stop:20566 length:177 start_codon:yes stop_codon:yes gene_type:complete